MWKLKTFKTEEMARDFIKENNHKYQMQFIFLNNAYGVEYKTLRKV